MSIFISEEALEDVRKWHVMTPTPEKNVKVEIKSRFIKENNIHIILRALQVLENKCIEQSIQYDYAKIANTLSYLGVVVNNNKPDFSSLYFSDYDKVVFNISKYGNFTVSYEDKIELESVLRYHDEKCTCDMTIIMRQGCQCGGI